MVPPRQLISSGTPWEPIVGYSRAVRSGPHVAISGTVGVNSDGTYSNSIKDQTERAFAIILDALKALGAKPEHVIRTRMFTTRIDLWEEIASVHGRIFSEIRPCTSLVGVAKLIDGEALIEIEADAIVI